MSESTVLFSSRFNGTISAYSIARTQTEEDRITPQSLQSPQKKPKYDRGTYFQNGIESPRETAYERRYSRIHRSPQSSRHEEAGSPLLSDDHQRRSMNHVEWR